MPGATFNMADAYAAFGVRVADGAMSVAAGADRTRLTSATAAFTQADRDKRIIVEGAGPAGADLKSFIKEVVNGTTVLLKHAASTTVAGSDISYVKGVYRLSELIRQGDVDGNHYEVMHMRRLMLSLGAQSPGGKLFVGGPFVTPTNCGYELDANESNDYAPAGGAGGGVPAVTSFDWLTSATANQKVNIYWIDDLNQATPAP